MDKSVIGIKTKVMDNICYTDLVYHRINKKLNKQLTKSGIEEMLLDLIQETDEMHFQKTGKNYYISNMENNIRITINSNTYRVITADVLNKNKRKQ